MIIIIKWNYYDQQKEALQSLCKTANRYTTIGRFLTFLVDIDYLLD